MSAHAAAHAVEQSTQASLNLQQARRLLYVSHALNQFSELAWQFCLVLLLAAISNYNLFLVSTYGISVGLATTLVLPHTGAKIDAHSRKGQRLVLARCWILSENAYVLLATMLCWYLLRNHNSDGNNDGNNDGYHDDDDDDGSAADGFDQIQATPSTADDGFSFATWSVVDLVCLVGIHLCGAAAQVMDRSFLVAVEKDWIVAMSSAIPPASSEKTPSNHPSYGETVSALEEEAEEEDALGTNKDEIAISSWLSTTNVHLKQIDLSCQIVAPAFSGWFISLWEQTNEQDPAATGVGNDFSGRNLSIAMLWVGAWNIAALVIELICISKIYGLVPELAQSVDSSIITVERPIHDLPAVFIEETIPRSDELVSPTNISNQQQNGTNPNEEDNNMAPVSDDGNETQPSDSIMDSFGHYWKQGPVAFGGIGLALLYLNILTFSGMLTAYLVSQGMSMSKIGMWRGLSSLVGLLGTFAYKASTTTFGWSLEFTGFWSIVWEFGCLSISAASLLCSPTNSERALALLIAGVLPSRLGLWVYDIAIVQMMQEQVPAAIRGRVGGVQSSLQSCLGFLPFCLGLLYPHTDQFSVFILSGYAAVGAAMLLFTLGVFIPYVRRRQTARSSRTRSTTANTQYELVKTSSRTTT